jgi:DNA-binding response OmpR family regulator
MTDVKQPSVLVVDDDVETLGIVEYWLADAGYDVVTCSRFDAARNYLASHSLDALVTDLRLGEFNGLQLALRASEPGRRIAVVVMSAYDDVVSRRDAEAVGGRFMLKPFDREELLAQISEALATTHGPR